MKRVQQKIRTETFYPFTFALEVTGGNCNYSQRDTALPHTAAPPNAHCTSECAGDLERFSFESERQSRRTSYCMATKRSNLNICTDGDGD